MRIANWERRLARTVEKWENAPFEWGNTDCAHFVDQCVAVVTGDDFLGPVFRNYDSRLTAAARLKAMGFRSVEDLAEAFCAKRAFLEIEPKFSAVGDIGITFDNVLCLRWAQGFIARSEDGKFYKVQCKRAWRVE